MQRTSAMYKCDALMQCKKEVKMGKRVIKKYSNRRLYDTETSKNITLEELGEMVSKGIDIQVIDNDTGEDITNLTLAQIIVELEKGKKKQEQVAELLKELITSGTTAMADLVQKSITESVSFLSISRDRVKEFVDMLVKDGRLAREEAGKMVEELWNTLQNSRKTFKEKLSQIFSEPTETVPGEEVQKLKEKIEGLENKLNEILSKLR